MSARARNGASTPRCVAARSAEAQRRSAWAWRGDERQARRCAWRGARWRKCRADAAAPQPRLARQPEEAAWRREGAETARLLGSRAGPCKPRKVVVCAFGGVGAARRGCALPSAARHQEAPRRRACTATALSAAAHAGRGRSRWRGTQAPQTPPSRSPGGTAPASAAGRPNARIRGSSRHEGRAKKGLCQPLTWRSILRAPSRLGHAAVKAAEPGERCARTARMARTKQEARCALPRARWCPAMRAVCGCGCGCAAARASGSYTAA